MATIAASPADRKASERKFYTRMALFLVFLVLLGFGPSFYLRNIVPSYPRPNPTLPPAVILHGTVFTLWMALIVTQTQLIAGRKHELHMRLGKAGMRLKHVQPVLWRDDVPLDFAGIACCRIPLHHSSLGGIWLNLYTYQPLGFRAHCRSKFDWGRRKPHGRIRILIASP